MKAKHSLSKENKPLIIKKLTPLKGKINHTIKTVDNCSIALNHHRKSFNKVVILAHGFFNNKGAYLFRKIAKMFNKYYDVISFDFRGHGRSKGTFSWTTHEGKDLQAIIDYAVNCKYKKIAVVGFSLGAAITLIQASKNASINSIISISSPYAFWKIDYHFWKPEMLQDLKLNMGPKGKFKSIRPGNPFLKKLKAIDIIENITIPILFMHGANDWLISKKHSETLYKKAKCKKKLYIVRNAGHAEKIFDTKPDEFEKVTIDWLKNTL